MSFEWDLDKDRVNRAKHGVAFEDAMLVWDDPLMVLTRDLCETGEPRWIALGRIGVTTILFVVHVYRGDEGEQRIRIISARKATRHERRKYDEDVLQR
jgi:uncharacterized DUF497 family protein